jgi:hypothetical protein
MRLRRLVTGSPTLFMVTLWVIFIIVLWFLTVLEDKHPQVTVAGHFLAALLEHRSEGADEYLSSHARIMAKATCPNGIVTGCADQFVKSAWGKFDRIDYLIATPNSESTWTVLFLTIWSDPKVDTVSVAVTTKLENQKWVVTGWRGFVEGTHYNGTDRINEFPTIKYTSTSAPY